jgi:hypothetical protein
VKTRKRHNSIRDNKILLKYNSTIPGNKKTLFSLLALQPNSGLGRLHETLSFTSVTSSRTVGRTPSTGDQLVARPLYLYTNKEKRTHNTNTKHPCPEWDSNPRSRSPRERRHFIPAYTARLPWRQQQDFT